VTHATFATRPRSRRASSVLSLAALLTAGCDGVPQLYVVNGSTTDATMSGSADSGAVDSGGLDAEGDGDGAPIESGPEACSGVSCPGCPPSPGACCPSGIPCEGNNCAAECTLACTSCTDGQICCAKKADAKDGGPGATCREADAGKCM